MPPTLLIVEDEPDLAALIARHARQSGFEPVVAPTAAEALVAARRRPAAILLDRMLPDASGLDVLRALRADPSTRGVPVLLVTALGEADDRVAGLTAGADDYVVKPFSPRELMLRLRAILRRRERPAWRVIAHERRVHVGVAQVDLTETEVAILAALLARPATVLSREALLDGLRDDRSVTTRAVDEHVKNLRRKLEPHGAEVEAIRGVGYRLVGANP